MINTLQSLLGLARQDQRISLQYSLGVLVALCVVPAVVVCGLLLMQNHALNREAVFRSTELNSREVLSLLDAELSAIESGLRVLATSDALQRGDLERFHREARNALKSQVVYNYILTDREGRQVINTLRPFGAPLPQAGTPDALKEVFRTGRTVLTDLFIGPVTQRPALAMGVPVTGDDGAVQYSLNIGLDPAYLNTLLARHALPQGWLMAIVDNQGTIVGRSRDAERYVGQRAVDSLVQQILSQPQGTLFSISKDGEPVVTAFVHSRTWGWTVVTGAPVAHIESEVIRTTTLVTLGLAAGFLVGILLAYKIARRVLDTVQQLNSAALALQQGTPIRMPTVQIKEAQAVVAAIQQAGQLMAEVRHRAFHDPLTQLGNRDLFQAVAGHQLAEAGRARRPLALLAIDLDHFKAVNDTEGHAVGDQLLQQVSRRIKGCIRESDLATRLGGDEFCVLLVDADAPIAQTIAQRIVEELARPFDGVHTRIGSSIGIAVYPGAGTTLQTLMDAADQALYQVKRSGRNAFAMAPDAAPTQTT